MFHMGWAVSVRANVKGGRYPDLNWDDNWDEDAICSLIG